MKITESQLRAVIKQELKKVLRENVQNVQDLIASFDELRYVYDQYDDSKILKFNKGQNIGELNVSELKQIFEYIDKNKPTPTTLNDLYGYTDWDEQTTMDEALGSFDEAATAETIADALGKKVSQYKHTEKEHSALRNAAAEREKKKWEDLRARNDAYIKSRGLSESKVDINDDEAVKSFVKKEGKDFKDWLATLNLKVKPMMPGDYKGNGGLVDRYLKIQARKGSK